MEPATARDLTAEVFGRHPFNLRVYYGDDRLRAYAPGAGGAVSAPGIQVMTPAIESALSATHGITATQIQESAGRLGTELRFLLNVACQGGPRHFSERLGQIAGAHGIPAVSAEDRRVLEAMKQCVDAAQGLGPQAIVKAAVGYLAGPAQAGGPAYGTLIARINDLLTNRSGNPRRRQSHPPVNGPEDIGGEGVELWWVKEGSATIVFQVRVALKGDRPPVSFVLNVAKDTTAAAVELRQVYGDFAELHRMDPHSVMEPLGAADVSLATRWGQGQAAVLAAEWFDGHELHVYEGSPQLYVWLDQEMGKKHPLAAPVSDQVWADTVRIRARCTRRTTGGLLPITTHVNAGDYIFRQRSDSAWDVLLIWARRPSPALDPGHFVVLAGMLPGVNIFGADEGRTVWWDQPQLALAALREGLAQAGLSASEIGALLRRAYEGPFTQYASSPESLPYLSLVRTSDPAEFRRVFQRAARELGAEN